MYLQIYSGNGWHERTKRFDAIGMRGNENFLIGKRTGGIIDVEKPRGTRREWW